MRVNVPDSGAVPFGDSPATAEECEEVKENSRVPDSGRKRRAGQNILFVATE